VAAASSRSSNGAITGINVTPLVDITLVLLIIFMVTAKLVVRRDAMTLDLPKATTGAEVQEIFSVAILADGSLRLDGQVIGELSLRERAAAALAANKDLRAVIQAEGAVPHRTVMHVLDLLRRAGVAKVGFGVVKESE
jgi:biopolymer transport protein ExbD